MADLRFALDEDVSHRVAGLLRTRGWKAASAKELGRLGLSDVRVLLQATRAGQILVTHNGEDFRTLHEAWVLWRQCWTIEVEQIVGHSVTLSRHAGIVTTPHMPPLELVNTQEEFAISAGQIEDRLFAWSIADGWDEFFP